MVIGIIAEYNPLHNGHIYQLNKIKEKYPLAKIIVLLTNYFSMRADICVLTKYDKTKLCLEYGVDLVIEFPYLLATQNADIFASNALHILNNCQIDILASGSEENDLELIKKIALLEDSSDFQEKMASFIKEGNSYRKSFSSSLAYFGFKDIKSNDLLNLKYYQAIKKNHYQIKLELFKRVGSDYLDENLNSIYASASAIRKNKDIKNYVPKETYNIYLEKGFFDINNFTDILKNDILNQDLSEIFLANEGIENLFDLDFINIDQLVEKLANKRYQRSRIRRFISYILTSYKKDLIPSDMAYIRPLGFNKNGQELLNKLKKEIKIIGTIKENINNILDFELKLAKLFSIVYKYDFVKDEQKLPIRKD